MLAFLDCILGEVLKSKASAGFSVVSSVWECLRPLNDAHLRDILAQRMFSPTPPHITLSRDTSFSIEGCSKQNNGELNAEGNQNFDK